MISLQLVFHLHLAHNFVNGYAEPYFWYGNLASKEAEVDVLFVSTNRGNTWKLNQNPMHKDQLAAMGFKPESTYGCVYNYLFK